MYPDKELYGAQGSSDGQCKQKRYKQKKIQGHLNVMIHFIQSHKVDVIGIFSALTLAACSSGNGTVDVDKALQDKTALEQYLKKGFIESKSNLNTNTEGPIFAEVMQDSATGNSTSSTAGGDNYSTTNTQESGVDEADKIKFNGDYLYAYKKSTPSYYTGGAEISVIDNSIAIGDVLHSSIEVYRTSGAPVASTHLTSLQLDEALYDTAGLYLTSDNLISLSQAYLDSGDRSSANAEVDYYSPWYWQSRAVDMSFYQLSNPAEPQQSYNLRIEGSMVGSRRIGNQLYLATKFTPDLNIENLYQLDTNQLAEKIVDIAFEDLLPRVWVNGTEQEKLFTNGSCYLPDLDNAGGYPSLVALIKIDLDNPQNWQAKCSSGRIDGVYASEDTFVVTGNHYQGKTRIDQYALSNLKLVATTKVAGSLNGAMPSFRMSAHDGYLRVITSSWNDFIIEEPIASDSSNDISMSNPAPVSNEIKHRLYVLKANAEQGFDQVAILPNEQNPKIIGKPREAIKSVRFKGDRAYVVTFLQTDPLYVINLTDNENPFIEGELEIEGFSQYLEPIGDDLLLGLGYAANTNGQTQGLKVSLFDVSNPVQPSEIRSYSLGGRGSSSQAMWDHKAISFIKLDDNTLRVSFTWSDAQNWDWLANKLHVFDVDTANNTMTTKLDAAYAERTSNGHNYQYFFEEYSRAPLHNDGVHLISNGTLISKPLTDW